MSVMRQSNRVWMHVMLRLVFYFISSLNKWSCPFLFHL
uniref:Uncharacterized protein n=1 Tax=Rhizophora mucronata TaxID=61149 RepID=A0A2P2PN83_RHIMU